MRAKPPTPLILAAVLTLSGCGPAPGTQPAAQEAPVVQPGAPGQPGRELPAGTPATKAPTPAAADVSFMQRMIHHHAQAVEMVELLKTRTTRDEMKLLGQRIEVSQTDEIKTMKAWLTDHDAGIPMDHGHGAMMIDGAMMSMGPGMASPEQMAALDKARGTTFDRLFLENMIRHHEGAIAMVADLLKSPGAGQESTVFDFITHVDADQRMEIGRMQRLLKDIR